MTIRYAERSDEAAIVRLTEQVHRLHAEHRPDQYKPFDAEATAVYYRLSADDPAHIYLLAEENGEPVGYAHLLIRERSASAVMQAATIFLIEDICVAEGCRRKGIGKALLTEAERLAELKGAQSIELCVWAFNEEAAAFYQKAGFTAQRSILERPIGGHLER
jgi:ribosomal protein S18 acetylase RimI-like enzyme